MGMNVLFLLVPLFVCILIIRLVRVKPYIGLGGRSQRPDFMSLIGGEKWGSYSSHMTYPSASRMIADKNIGPKSEFKIKHVPFAPFPQEPVAIRRSWLNVQVK